MKLSLTTKFDVDDRVWFDGQGPDDTGTVTKVVVTRDPGTEYLKVEYLVDWDHGVNPGDENNTLEAYVLHHVEEAERAANIVAASPDMLADALANTEALNEF